MYINQIYTISTALVLALWALNSCVSKSPEAKEEQIRVSADTSTMAADSSAENLSLKIIATVPTSVILTGMPQHRLITIYKKSAPQRHSTYYDREADAESWHYMPGIDLISGYNLLNVAHYDLSSQKLTYFFEKPVLVNSLYYPSFRQDSLYKKPIYRNYYLVSVYDTDTNRDTLINRKDMRHLYSFDASGTQKITLVPLEYSVVRSEYDPRNDAMYVYARHDSNANGSIDKTEPMHIFWVDLKSPTLAKKMY